MNTPILNGLKAVANLMAVSACTAPKAGGADWIQSKVATGKEKNNISILGIPLSVTGKNIFFDRPEKLEAWKILK